MADELDAVDESTGDTPVAPAILRRVVAAAGFVLIAVTWRLWTPQTLFPQVPFFLWAGQLPAVLEWFGLALMLAGLCCALFGRSPSRTVRLGLTLFAVATAFMVLVDQHRLQPWAYQLCIAAIVLAWASPQRCLPLLRLLTISLYFHSAVSKLDFSFLESNGQQLVGALLDSIGLSMKFWSPEIRRGVAAALPVGELLIAVGLAIPWTRRWAMSCSGVMHGLLLMALGPWGLGHQPGVLVWNVYFIVQNWLLFGGLPKAELEQSAVSGRRWVDAVVILVVLFPLMEPWNRCDHWPAWAVYAAHPAKVRVSVDGEGVERLPEAVRSFVGQKKPFDRWREVSIERWSLESLGVPIYPQDRFQLGVAIWLARVPGLEDEVRVVIEGRADRWTGKRSRREVVGLGAMEEEANRFLLNAYPRRVVAGD